MKEVAIFMEYIDNRINHLIYNLNRFSRQDFEKGILDAGIDISEKSLSRILAKLINNQLIIRIKRNQYETVKENIRFDFDYELSHRANEINQNILKKYPLIEYQIWDLTVLNQFLNHLLSHNCIFVEVESDLVDTVFDLLSEEGYHVLLDPDDKMFFRYSRDGVVIVRKLISQAPNNVMDKKKISLERLLVDIVVDKLIQSIISYTEIPDIYHECLLHYNINLKKVLRYASRRNSKDRIEKIIEGDREDDKTRKLHFR